MYNFAVEKIVTNLRFYKIIGFTIVRSVLEKTDIQKVRDHINDLYRSHNIIGRELSPKFFLESSILGEIVFQEKIVNVLKKIFGPSPVMIGDFHCFRNNFGGWHVDSGSENMAHYLFNKNYGCAKCGIFLQDNSNIHGGSIRIRWLSHLFVYNKLPLPFRYLFQKLYGCIKSILSHTVKLNAGDFIVFDSRLEHSSYIPNSIDLTSLEDGYLEQPHANSKYVIYWDTCNKWSVKSFLDNSIRRAFMDEYIRLSSSYTTYTDYLSRHFPTDFPEEFVNNVYKNNIQIATLEGPELIKMQNFYNFMLLKKK